MHSHDSIQTPEARWCLCSQVAFTKYELLWCWQKLDGSVLFRPKKRSIGEDLKASGGKVIKMGNPELTRLWNLNTDNMAACKSQSRFVPPSPAKPQCLGLLVEKWWGLRAHNHHRHAGKSCSKKFSKSPKFVDTKTQFLFTWKHKETTFRVWTTSLRRRSSKRTLSRWLKTHTSKFVHFQIRFKCAHPWSFLTHSQQTIPSRFVFPGWSTTLSGAGKLCGFSRENRVISSRQQPAINHWRNTYRTWFKRRRKISRLWPMPSPWVYYFLSDCSSVGGLCQAM